MNLRDRIGVQVIRTLSEAKNLALKAELMQQERGRRNFGGYRNNTGSEEASEIVERDNNFKNSDKRNGDDKAAGKRPVYDGRDKEVKKADNPYAKPGVRKCYRCHQPGHKSNECPTRKTVNVVERDEEDDGVDCEPEEDKEKGEDNGSKESS